MPILKNTILAVVLLVILAVIKRLLDVHSPGTIVYHDLLLFDYQLLILFWLLLFIVIKLFFPNVKTRTFNISVLIFLVATELLFSLMMYHPSSIPERLKPTFRLYYTSFHRNIIQYDSCSEYDSAFFYRLKPNAEFTFSNIEFSNKFSTNRLGMRDTDSSVIKPEILCMGDSYMLGWGVEENQTFASLIRKSTNKKLLNTSMSSYGTARETKWLTKIDTSNLKYIIIQYCSNDIDENHFFNQSNNILPISSKKVYEEARQEYVWGNKYFPGKYSITISYYLFKGLLRHIISPKTISDEAGNPPNQALEFIKVIQHAKIDFNKVKILLIDAEAFPELHNNFIHSVDSVIALKPYKNLKNAIQTIDISGILSPADYYILDAHIKPSGHKKIADALIHYIKP